MSQSRQQAIRDVVKGAGVVYLGLVTQYLIAFVVQVLAARFLELSEFGGVITGTAVLDVGAILGTVGLGLGLARYLPRVEESRQRGYVLAALGVAVPVALAVGLGVVFGADQIATELFGDPSVTQALLIFGVAVPFAAVMNVAIGGIRGRKNSRYRVYLKNFLHPLTRFGLVLAAVAYGLGEVGILGAYAAPYVVTAVVALALLRRALPPAGVGSRIEAAGIVELFRFSVPLSLSEALKFVVRSSDIFLLVYFLNSSAVAVYGVAYAMARLLLMFSTAFDFLGMPVASELDSASLDSEVVELNESILRWLVILSVPVLFPILLYPGAILGFIYRPEYATGGTALVVLAVGFAVHNALSINASLVTALGRSKVILLNNLLAAVVNIALNVALIPEFGIVGAAAATTAAYLVRDVALTVEAWRLTGYFPLSRKVLRPVAIAIPAIGVGAAASTVLPVGVVTVAALTAAVGAGYVVLILFVLGIAPEEVMLIRSAQDRFGLEHPLVDSFVEYFS